MNCLNNSLFSVKQCPPILPPKNGLLVKFNNLYQVRCAAGTFPATELGLGVYVCNNGEWVSMSGGPFPIPDCIRKFKKIFAVAKAIHSYSVSLIFSSQRNQL